MSEHVLGVGFDRSAKQWKLGFNGRGLKSFFRTSSVTHVDSHYAKGLDSLKKHYKHNNCCVFFPQLHTSGRRSQAVQLASIKRLSPGGD